MKELQRYITSNKFSFRFLGDQKEHVSVQLKYKLKKIWHNKTFGMVVPYALPKGIMGVDSFNNLDFQFM